MKILLESGVWLADGEGDPSRVTREENAAEFSSMDSAVAALAAAREYRPFINAEIYEDFF